ncbi:MAG TPA: diaminopimelate dehydrogenase [Pseudothermotoga sp.]|nr:diaminopimelate dehydrogenase [Pseudothermotoga sp.]HOK83825.1 diaminopimelate dehydrogenase [Pseudothermotoga sp.]HPP70272.1 diaminopimelate dehydrogenase [Pseudothermotoga sp.]
MGKIRVAIVGMGNVGHAVFDCVSQAQDMELVGIVEIPQRVKSLEEEFRDIPVVDNVEDLPKPDVAILAIDSRVVPKIAPQYLKLGINTVDAYDIHGAEGALRLKKDLDVIAKENGAVSIISAGWDPGSDSIVRVLFEMIAPKGITWTNFGPGMSMGHTVAVKRIEGVKDAVSITCPKGMGMHSRLVYVQLEEGYDFADVAKKIAEDPYFSHDELHINQVSDVSKLVDMGHSVKIERKGTSGKACNQRMEFHMWVNNPAATAQVMVASARATTKQRPGCYTLLEIPVIDFLCGEREELICRLL